MSRQFGIRMILVLSLCACLAIPGNVSCQRSTDSKFSVRQDNLGTNSRNADRRTSNTLCSRGALSKKGETCTSVAAQNGITRDKISTVSDYNPGIDCSKTLPAGTCICLGTMSMAAAQSPFDLRTCRYMNS